MRRRLVLLTTCMALLVGACGDSIEGVDGCDELTAILNDLLDDPNLDSTEIGDILDSAFIKAILLQVEAEERGNPIEISKCENLASELGSVFGAFD